MRAFTIADMRIQRPSRDQLKAAVKGSKGNLTEVASKLGCSRPTLYKWIDQLDLRDFVGVRSAYTVDDEPRAGGVGEVYDGESGGHGTRGKRTRERVLIFPDMATGSTLPDTFRRQRSVTISEGMWRWARVEAAKSDRTAADVIEAALVLYRRRMEMKRRKLAGGRQPDAREDE